MPAAIAAAAAAAGLVSSARKSCCSRTPIAVFASLRRVSTSMPFSTSQMCIHRFFAGPYCSGWYQPMVGSIKLAPWDGRNRRRSPPSLLLSYVCERARMCVCLCVVHVYMRMGVDVRVYIYACVYYVYMRIYKYIFYASTCMYVCVYVCVRAVARSRHRAYGRAHHAPRPRVTPLSTSFSRARYSFMSPSRSRQLHRSEPSRLEHSPR